MTEKACLGIVGIAVGVIVLLLLILLPISFVGLEYYEVSDARGRSKMLAVRHLNRWSYVGARSNR